MSEGGGLQAIRYSRGRLEVLDQLRLPHEQHYDLVSTSEEAYDCIKSMRVRGAPAIAIVAALAHAVELHNGSCGASTPEETISYIDGRLAYLKQSRPTAVDLTNAIDQLGAVVRAVDVSGGTAAGGGGGGEGARDAIVAAYIAAAEEIFRKDRETNLLIGEHGVAWLLENAAGGGGGGGDEEEEKKKKKTISLLTHCNTGSLATSGHGTALGIVRSLHAAGRLRHAFCTETRPYNQGSRLTAFELAYERIPSTLICDSMAAALFRTRMATDDGRVAAVVVGADRVARNGDTANKVGTYGLAVLARHHGVRFVVAAPTTSVDLRTARGDDIRIEERRPEELTQTSGAVVGPDGRVDTARTERVATAHQGIAVWNPAFDVTPAELIDAIVTERGVVVKGAASGEFDFQSVIPERWAQVIG
ncbi:methylthioribose-1-phosphate isomerase [Xylariaceae sp. FL0804]|nr:methylthioribose-1-phosphate isomerase [Xylariaceae sp. FL0804]